jgi:hypothetical protein
LATLYPGMVNSPVTELAAAIDATATTATVKNGAALPDAPNIATIGKGDNAETILYAGKSGNTLSSVTRGFQGMAQSWPINTKLARNFTAYDYDTIREALAEGQTIPAPIVRGANVINATQASGATFKIIGRTLVNLLGIDGNFENSLGGWTYNGGATRSFDTANVREGLYSAKATTAPTNASFHRRLNLELGKKYLLGVWMFNSTNQNLGIQYGPLSIKTSAVKNEWVLLTQKVTGYGEQNYNFYLYASLGAGTTGDVWFDGAFAYEVTDADYTLIDTLSTAQIYSHWPYVDGVQHTQGVGVMMPGKNLLKGVPDSMHQFAVLNNLYDSTISATAADQRVEVNSAVMGGAKYTFRVDSSGTNAKVYVWYYDAIGVAIGSGSTELPSGSPFTVLTAPSNAVRIRIMFTSPGPGIFTYKNWMLVLGDVSSLPASFTPYNPQYAHATIKLASNVDRTIADSYESATGQVFRRWLTGFKLDGLLSWTFVNDQTGTKRIRTVTLKPYWDGSKFVYYLVKYDGKILGVNALNGADTSNFTNVSSVDYINLEVADTESGWTESLNPSPNAIKALTNGWRAAGNNGTAYNSWVSILDGSPAPTNTEAYVAANKVTPGFYYAMLDYVRATPITETMTGDLGGLSMVKGGNAVELLEGVIVRERVYPQIIAASGFREINGTQSGVLSYLSKRAEKIIAVYKGADKDDKWTTATNLANGQSRAYIPPADYNPAAEYYVDYIVLDKYAYTANAVDATLTYQSTSGGTVAQATQDIARIKAQMGVHEWQLMLDEAYADNLRMDLDAATARATNNIRALSQGGMI